MTNMNDPTDRVSYDIWQARKVLRDLLDKIERRELDDLMNDKEYESFAKDIAELELLIKNIAIFSPRLSKHYKDYKQN